MKKLTVKLGRWYPSKEKIRKHYCEYWKGILINTDSTSIIFNYRGARRHHYGDKLDYKHGMITYVGEGKSGNQALNSRNQALINARKSNNAINVYLDCGDLFSPKHLLYAGKWYVKSYRYTTLSSENKRKVYKFKLEPNEQKILDFLHFTFSAVGEDADFERDLVKFAKARETLYKKHAGIMRARDNILGEIGEYFAIKAFNKNNKQNHLIRLTSAFRDIDAIRIGNGARYAIKTVSKIPSATSSIWSTNIENDVDYFLICYLDPDELKPHFVCQISVKEAINLLRHDNYQGSKKLTINNEFIKKSRFLFGNKKEWIKNN